MGAAHDTPAGGEPVTTEVAPSRPVQETLQAIAALTQAQRATLRRLGELGEGGEPVTAADLAEATGVRSSSVREILDALLAAGLVERSRMPAVGPGRPRYGYLPVVPTDVDAPLTMLVDLFSATIRVLRLTHPDPALAAEQIGAQWGDQLIGGMVPDHSDHDAQAYADLRLADHMDKIAYFSSVLGFPAVIPPDRPTDLAITACPFVRDGRVDPLVCRMHAGLLDRVVDRTSGGRVDTELEPFAEPSVCVARLIQRVDAADERGVGGRRRTMPPVPAAATVLRIADRDL